MFSAFFRRDEKTNLDRIIDRVEDKLYAIGPTDENYSLHLGYLERLYELKSHQRRKQVNPDTLYLIAGNLTGILMIVAYEQKHVMTSKGFSQIIRPS